MKISLRLAGYAMGFAALALTGAYAQTPGLTITLVKTFDYPGTGNQTRAQKINDNGDVAGLFLDGSTGASKGFIMFADGTFSQPIVDPNDSANLTEVRGINNAQTVCGDYTNSSAAFEGFFRDIAGTFTDYDPSASFTLVLGINNAGNFCGSDIPSSGVQSGYVNVNGTLTEFTVPTASATLTYQINGGNEAVGYYNDSGGASHGYFREPTGQIRAPIDPAGSTTTIIFGNNNHNTAVGRYVDVSGNTHGMVFIPPKHFLTYDFPGATFTSLNGINKNNDCVGRYTDPNTGIDHGIIVHIHGGADGHVLGMANPNAAMKDWRDRPENHIPAY